MIHKFSVACDSRSFQRAIRAVSEAILAARLQLQDEPAPLFHPDPWEHREAAPAIPEE